MGWCFPTLQYLPIVYVMRLGIISLFRIKGCISVLIYIHVLHIYICTYIFHTGSDTCCNAQSASPRELRLWSKNPEVKTTFAHGAAESPGGETGLLRCAESSEQKTGLNGSSPGHVTLLHGRSKSPGQKTELQELSEPEGQESMLSGLSEFAGQETASFGFSELPDNTSDANKRSNFPKEDASLQGGSPPYRQEPLLCGLSESRGQDPAECADQPELRQPAAGARGQTRTPLELDTPPQRARGEPPVSSFITVSPGTVHIVQFTQCAVQYQLRWFLLDDKHCCFKVWKQITTEV
jgi:hypothetical protein